MKFDRKFFEEQGQIKEDPESSAEKLIPFIKEISESLKKEKVPVDEDCRIDMKAFSSYGDGVEKDIESVKDREQKWYPNLSEERIKEEKQKKSGEKLEMLVVALFHKFLKDKFIVTRSSPYDDVFNGIDTLILEKETGDLICAFDEVADAAGPNLQNKIKEITEKNKNGGTLRYGLKMENGEIKKGVVMGAPIFYIALPEKHINEGIKNLSLSLEEKSDYEKKLFKYFIDLLQHQYSALVLEKHIDQSIKNRVGTFKKVLDKFKESR